MPSVRVKDVPDDVHAVLRQRAAAAHQSLQEYLRSRLIAEASRPLSRRYSIGRVGARVGPCRSRVRCRRSATTVLVVDASVLAVALADDSGDGDAARARLRGQGLAAPELLDLEVLSVLRGQMSAGTLDVRRADDASLFEARGHHLVHDLVEGFRAARRGI